MAKKRYIKWVGLKFDSADDFAKFVADAPSDVRPYIEDDERYIVGDGPDLVVIYNGDEIIGFGQEGTRSVRIAHVRSVLSSMDCGGREVNRWRAEKKA